MMAPWQIILERLCMPPLQLSHEVTVWLQAAITDTELSRGGLPHRQADGTHVNSPYWLPR